MFEEFQDIADRTDNCPCAATKTRMLRDATVEDEELGFPPLPQKPIKRRG
jgi:hypothetical protein